MVDVWIAEPGELIRSQLQAAESLVRTAFGDSFREHDWLHGVDGVHVVVTDNEDVVAHASVVPRELQHGRTAFDAGYVEGVAVRADHQGRGLGGVVMDHAESIIGARHQIGALNAVDTAAAFYAARGWHLWSGPTAALSATGVVDTWDRADRIFIYPSSPDAPLDSAVTLVCDWRAGDLW